MSALFHSYLRGLKAAEWLIAMSVLVLNLRKIQCTVFQLLAYLRAIFSLQEKWAIVQ